MAAAIEQFATRVYSLDQVSYRVVEYSNNKLFELIIIRLALEYLSTCGSPSFRLQ